MSNRNPVVKFFDDIVNRIRGKGVVLLGERTVGKTVLSTYLADGEIPAEYVQTLAPERRPPNRIKPESIPLRLKGIVDVSGDETAYNLWRELHGKAHLVLYLFRVDRMLSNGADGRGTSTRERVIMDLGQIRRWREENKPLFVLVGSHCDKVPDYDPSAPGDFHTRFEGSTEGRKVLLDAGGMSTPLVLGRLDTEEGRQRVVVDILKHYKQHANR